MSVVDELEHRAARQSGRRAGDDTHQDVRTLGFLGALPPEVQDSLSRDTHRAGYPRGSRIRDPGSAPQPEVIFDCMVRALVSPPTPRHPPFTHPLSPNSMRTPTH